MKLNIILIAILGFSIFFIMSPAYAPCMEGLGINCSNYPPPSLSQIKFDKLNYETSDKPIITIMGAPNAVAHLEIDDSSSSIIFTHDINLAPNGTAIYTLDILSYKPGVYSVTATSLMSKLTTGFSVGLMPTGGHMFLNTDKSSYLPGDHVIILGTLNSNTLVQLSLIDPNGIPVESIQTFSDKTGHFSSLDFNIPSTAITGTWKIHGASGVSNVSVNLIVENIMDTQIDKAIVPSPLKQFKSGTNTGFITCKPGFYFVLKSYDREPLCLKAGTISKLASRGFLFATSTSNDNYTTVIISPGSENQASPNTYSPNVITVVLGINNTVRWINQADVANEIVPDMPLTQNEKSFGSNGVIKPDQSYTFTFTEPGTFAYHTEPHPWMKGTVIVLPPSYQITGTKANDPFGITALVIYKPQIACLSPPAHSAPSSLPICPPNNFYLKINSNSTAYLLGYNICDDNSCATNNTLSLLLPLNTGLHPDYQMIGLPVDLQWKMGDIVNIQITASHDADNKTTSQIDLGSSTIVP